MTTETIVESAPTGAVEQQVVSGAPGAAGAAGLTGNAETAATVAAGPTFSAEQQAHIDKLIGERLKRDRAKWQSDAEAKAKADADTAEAQRQAEQGEWEALARKRETAEAEAKAQVKDLSARLERADAVIEGLVESRKKGLPEAMLKALDGRDIYDQLEIANAFHEALPEQPANGTAPPRGASTTPTPAPQGAHKLTEEERRQRARSSW